jgi:hypothetical protein
MTAVATLKVLDATVQNLVTWATWRPGFVHACSTLLFLSLLQVLHLLQNYEPLLEAPYTGND